MGLGGARLGEVGPCEIDEHAALAAATGGADGATARHEPRVEGGDRGVLEELVGERLGLGFRVRL